MEFRDDGWLSEDRQLQRGYQYPQSPGIDRRR